MDKHQILRDLQTTQQLLAVEITKAQEEGNKRLTRLLESLRRSLQELTRICQ